MRTQYTPCIIFSVERHDLNHSQNVLNVRQAEQDMNTMGIKFERLLGVYKGSEEVSLMVTDMSHVRTIIGMAKEFNQESILLRDNENNCTLQYLSKPNWDMSNRFESIGKLKQVGVDEALQSDSYTYSYRLKSYFVCS